MGKICYANGDDADVKDVISTLDSKVITYGFDETNDYHPQNIKPGKYGYCFDVVKNGEVVLLHNALSTDDYRFSQEKRNKYREEFEVNGKFVIGHVGRFNIQKNHDFLIEVFKEFCKINSNAVSSATLESKAERAFLSSPCNANPSAYIADGL